MIRNGATTLSVPNLPGMLPDRQAWVYVSNIFQLYISLADFALLYVTERERRIQKEFSPCHCWRG
jgi:hypothetical protein